MGAASRDERLVLCPSWGLPQPYPDDGATVNGFRALGVLRPVGGTGEGRVRDGQPAGDVRPAATDVEILWSPEFDGLVEPSDETSTGMGIGDYGPTARHRRFES